MRVLALVDRQYSNAARRAVGRDAHVLTFPPTTAANLTPRTLNGWDVIYIDLHGDRQAWAMKAGKYKEVQALTPDVVTGASLSNTVIIATTCYLDTMPILLALLRAGATVIGGSGENYAPKYQDAVITNGAQELARLVIKELGKGVAAEQALETAKSKMRYSWRRLVYRKATDDALQFQLWRKYDHGSV